MTRQMNSMSRLGLVLLLVAVLLPFVGAGAAVAGPPQPAKGQGDKCVAPTDWMRRYHMTVLHHQRDDTVHEGVRTQQFSLKGCIDCHQVKGPDGKAVTVSDPKHFCRTCHDYAAVRVDCFECHASRPGEKDKAAAAGEPPRDAVHAAVGAAATADVTAAQTYLKEVGR